MKNSPNRLQPDEKEWQYRNIFDTATDGLIISDLGTGLVVEANPAACMMHGYPRAEFIGLHLTAFIHPDSQQEFNTSAGKFGTLHEMRYRYLWELLSR